MRLVRPVTSAVEPIPRRPGAVRRVSCIDSVWDGDSIESFVGPNVAMHQHAYARDVRDGAVLAEARVATRLEGFAQLASVRVEPETAGAEALVGAHVGSGFRARVAGALPGLDGSPLGLLLDDLPVATLVAGYSRVLRRIDAGMHPSEIVGPDGADARRDLCAGWRAGGSMIRSIEAGDGIPYHPLPQATVPVARDDPLDWPDEPPLEVRGMRRRRRIDVSGGEVVVVEAWFRDSHVERAEPYTEGAVHEYSLHASLAPDTFEILSITATPHVLPYGECPAAAAHVSTLVGARAADLRRVVRERITGTSSCTHLNDCLRSLADVPALAARLDP